MLTIEKKVFRSVISLILLGSITIIPVAWGENLTLGTWGGIFQEAQRNLLAEPYSKATGTNISLVSLKSDVLRELRTQNESGNVLYDIVMLDGSSSIIACELGLLKRVNENEILEGKYFLNHAIQECAVATAAEDMHVILY